MNHFGHYRSFLTGLFFLTLLLSSSVSIAARNYYLKLAGQNGKSYTAKIQADGSFTFAKIEPGTYTLLCVCDDGNTPRDPSEEKKKDKDHIEIHSWSWGTSNATIPSSSGTGSTGNVDKDKDGDPDLVTKSPISLSNMTCSAGKCEKIIHRDLAVRMACSPSGKVSISSFNSMK